MPPDRMIVDILFLSCLVCLSVCLSVVSFRSVCLNKDAAQTTKLYCKMADSTSANNMTSQEINITLSVHYF